MIRAKKIPSERRGDDPLLDQKTLRIILVKVYPINPFCFNQKHFLKLIFTNSCAFFCGEKL